MSHSSHKKGIDFNKGTRAQCLKVESSDEVRLTLRCGKK
jgi:hypothetical protein